MRKERINKIESEIKAQIANISEVIQTINNNLDRLRLVMAQQSSFRIKPYEIVEQHYNHCKWSVYGLLAFELVKIMASYCKKAKDVIMVCSIVNDIAKKILACYIEWTITPHLVISSPCKEFLKVVFSLPMPFYTYSSDEEPDNNALDIKKMTEFARIAPYIYNNNLCMPQKNELDLDSLIEQAKTLCEMKEKFDDEEQKLIEEHRARLASVNKFGWDL